MIATWSDGWVEDVTPLCRFRVNDESIADVDENGAVTSKGAGDTHVIVFYDGAASVAQVLRPVSRQFGARYPEVTTTTQVDALIIAKLRKLGIVPSELCSDTEFLRRISLDMTGTLPTPEEIECFSKDPSPAKRAAKIDELLERETYVARWTTRLCELVGNHPRHFQDLAPPEEYARHWYEWIARRVRANVPYDELVTGIILGRSRLEGESYDEYIARQSSYYREHEAADFTALDNMPYYGAKRTSRTPGRKSNGERNPSPISKTRSACTRRTVPCSRGWIDFRSGPMTFSVRIGRRKLSTSAVNPSLSDACSRIIH